MSEPFRQSGEIVSVNVSLRKGVAKRPVPQGVIDEMGLCGDAHAGVGTRQLSLLSREAIDAFAAGAPREIAPGEFAENLTTRGIDMGRVAILDRFTIGEAVLEVTGIGKECHGEGCEIYRRVGRCLMPKEGIFCRVLAGGSVRPGQGISHAARVLRFRIITASDRVRRGEYPDRSGPRAKEMIEEFFLPKRRQIAIETSVLPDELVLLKEAIEAAHKAGTDAIVVTGGTGVGPRDVTPEAVASVAEKTIPGIMEAIRMKFGRENPKALLSRSVAAVRGESLIYAIPGSPKAVEEYMGEILGTLEHLILMLHGIDAH